MTLRASTIGDLIDRKRRAGEHSPEEIQGLVKAFCAGDITDAPFAEWLRAVQLAGMSVEETAALTRAMADSGTLLDWNDVDGVVVDKHSTGGVGDAVSLIAVPLAAACGIKVAKLSGRALGHTGGTIDKLECIPGLRTQLRMDEFKRQVVQVGCSMVQASEQLAPADKKMYALRDRTNTVASIPLITASVLSKKLAGGAPNLVIDVKCGRCAFMQTLPEARELAHMILRVGQRLGRHMTVLITDMESPLADSIGDALDLDEALNVLQGKPKGRLREVALEVTAAMLAVHQQGDDDFRQAHAAQLESALLDGSALERFAAMASAQGGDLRAFDRAFTPSLAVVADRAGFVSAIDGRALAELVRLEKGAVQQAARARVGIRLRKREGDAVKPGDVLMEAFVPSPASKLADTLRGAVTIAPTPPLARPAIIERMHANPEPAR